MGWTKLPLADRLLRELKGFLRRSLCNRKYWVLIIESFREQSLIKRWYHPPHPDHEIDPREAPMYQKQIRSTRTPVNVMTCLCLSPNNRARNLFTLRDCGRSRGIHQSKSTLKYYKIRGHIKQRCSRCCGLSVVSLFHCTFHAWVGWVGEIKYGLIAVARGALTSWRPISLK